MLEQGGYLYVSEPIYDALNEVVVSCSTTRRGREQAAQAALDEALATTGQ